MVSVPSNISYIHNDIIMLRFDVKRTHRAILKYEVSRQVEEPQKSKA